MEQDFNKETSVQEKMPKKPSSIFCLWKKQTDSSTWQISLPEKNKIFKKKMSETQPI